MRGPLRSALLAEGNTDVVLCSHLTWLLQEHIQHWSIDPTQFVESVTLAGIPKGDLAERMRQSYEEYPYEIIFVHRDADSVDAQPRHKEIQQAFQQVRQEIPHVVAVVPIQETEAWLLFDEKAIRQAADNPNSKMPLNLPTKKNLERLAQPKEKLHEILMKASLHNGKQPRKFDVDEAVKNIATNIKDFSPLRALSAFRALESAIQKLVQEQHW